MESIIKEVKEKMNTNPDFVNKFIDHVVEPDDMISFSEIQDWVGYKKKETVLLLLKNNKNIFIENEHYNIKKIKIEGVNKPINEIYMTADTVKNICLMASTEKGQQFRKYYIELEKCFKKVMIENIKLQTINITNPIDALKKYEFDPNQYKKKEVFYILYINNSTYKFGITGDLFNRLRQHRNTIKYDFVVKCFDTINRTLGKKIEDAFKLYIRHNKLQTVYNNETECFKTTDKINIDKLMEIISKYVDFYINEHNKENKLDSNNSSLNNNINLLLSRVNELLGKLENKKNEIIEDKLDKIEQIDFDEDQNNNEQEVKENVNDELFCFKKCVRCKSNKMISDFGTNEELNQVYKQCFDCRKKERENPVRIEKKKIIHKKYREKNCQILNEYHKQRRLQIKDEIKNIDISKDSTNEVVKPCRRCHNKKTLNEFGIDIKTETHYLTCIACRNRRKQTDTLKKSENLKISNDISLVDEPILNTIDCDLITIDSVNEMENELCSNLVTNDSGNKSDSESDSESDSGSYNDLVTDSSNNEININSFSDVTKEMNYSTNSNNINSRKCQRCTRSFTEEEFGLNKKIEPYKNCTSCREKQKESDAKRLITKLELNRKYYEKNKDEYNEKRREKRKLNPKRIKQSEEELKEKQKIYYEKNRDKILQKKKEYYDENK